jgi:hypothetical protein
VASWPTPPHDLAILPVMARWAFILTGCPDTRHTRYMNTTQTLTHRDLGNNESVATGYAKNSDGTFTALTNVQSKTFKTERGAVAWLAKRGYNADGTRA